MDSRNVTQYSLVAAKEKESSCYISAVVAGMRVKILQLFQLCA